MCRLRKSYPCRHQDEDDPRTKTTDTCVDSQSMCLCEYEDKKEAANEIEQLREALNCVILYWDEWKDASDNHPTALSLEEVVLIARDSLKE